jgi:hypothetical protein
MYVCMYVCMYSCVCVYLNMAAYGAGHGVQRVQRLCQVIVFQPVRIPVVLHAYMD